MWKVIILSGIAGLILATIASMGLEEARGRSWIANQDPAQVQLLQERWDLLEKKTPEWRLFSDSSIKDKPPLLIMTTGVGVAKKEWSGVYIEDCNGNRLHKPALFGGNHRTLQFVRETNVILPDADSYESIAGSCRQLMQ